MRKLLLFVVPVLLLYACPALPQSVAVSFNALPEGEVRAYYFLGDHLDSLIIKLDRQGKGSSRFPENYKGLIRAVVNKASLVEFIAGEDTVFIESDSLRPSRENVSFPGSEENAFFFSMLERKKRNEQEHEWLIVGANNYLPLRQEINNTLIINAEEKAAIEQEIASSSLYAARLLEIIGFADDLFLAENQRNIAKIAYVKDYLPKQMDWNALYTSGQFWNMVHNYYLSMFNKEDPSRPLSETQKLYATSAAPLLLKTEGEVRTAMFKSIVSECEAFGWEQAKTDIISFVTDNNITIDSQNPFIARIMQSYQVQAGKPAPDIAGVDNLHNSLVVFYESGCDNCMQLLEELKSAYPALQRKGIRIVSVAADDNQNIFYYYANGFPWKDRICDFKGFKGDSFADYGVTATPTIFLTDKEGKILGRYARLQDTGLLQ